MPPATQQDSSAVKSDSAVSVDNPAKKSLSVCSGVIRKGKRTKDLIKRLRPGEIALIDHIDLDAMAAQGLVDCRTAGVINASSPISGRYPNRGPSILEAAKVPLYALNDTAFYDKLQDGDHAVVYSDGALQVNDERLPRAVTLWTSDQIATALANARGNLTSEIQRFADNTLSFVKSEAITLLEPTELPELAGVPKIDKHHVVIVVRGEGYREDLKSISGYLSDVNPVVIGVDGGADALLEAGIKPHVIIGDMDSVTDKALMSGACLVVHAYATTGESPGSERLEMLGLKPESFRIPGTSEDAAMLLAYEKGAELIVVVGTHSNLEDFLDKGRAGMASTFLTRLKVGSRLVDARGVSKLHAPRVGGGAFLAVILSAMFPVVMALRYSPKLSQFRELVLLWWRISLVNWHHLVRQWHWHY